MIKLLSLPLIILLYILLETFTEVIHRYGKLENLTTYLIKLKLVQYRNYYFNPNNMFQDFQQKENRVKKHTSQLTLVARLIKYMKTGKSFKLIF
jgi:hypothetical protein